MEWRWKYFSKDELKCKCCGEYRVVPSFLDRLTKLRIAYGKPMRITSAYRCPQHNAKVSRTGADGPHTTGQAVDVSIHGGDALVLVGLAIEHGFTGIGISQKGDRAGRFIHLDDINGSIRPTIWSY